MITSLSIGTGGLGRFGNQLYTIAGVIGIAKRSGQPFAFPEWKNYDNQNFTPGEDIDIQKYFQNPLPLLSHGYNFNNYGYFWGYREVHLPIGDWTIDAHLQSPKYFDHCRETICHYFTFANEYPLNDAIALHIRFGDYIDDPNAYHPVCSAEYYKHAISYLDKGTKVFVFSDGTDEQIETRIAGIENTEVIKGMDYIESFRLMKSCKHFITANSSFSAMAAYLGNHPDKKIVMPKKWFGDIAGINGDDIYPLNSIVI